MYDKCYFCLDQLRKLTKESTVSFFVNFGRSRGTKEPTYFTVLHVLLLKCCNFLLFVLICMLKLLSPGPFSFDRQAQTCPCLLKKKKICIYWVLYALIGLHRYWCAFMAGEGICLITSAKLWLWFFVFWIWMLYVESLARKNRAYVGSYMLL